MDIMCPVFLSVRTIDPCDSHRCDAGAAEALAVAGVGMFSIMMMSALAIRRPHDSYSPPGFSAPPIAATPTPTATATGAVGKPDQPLAAVPGLTVDEVMRQPQFYLLGTTFWCLATGGMGMFSVAKPMMSEVFSSVLPTIVTSAFASKFLLMISGGNLGKSHQFHK